MSKFSNLLNSARKSERYWLGRVKYDVAAQLQDLLKDAGITQDKYAEKLGVKAPQVSRTLSGSTNPTLETMVKMGWALGYIPRVTFVPVQQRQIEVTDDTGVASFSLNIALTKAALADYHFDLPSVDFEGWKVVTNDERFEIAA